MTKMLKKLFDIDPSFFEWHAVGEIVNRFSNVQAINNIIINTFSQVAVQIITSTICLVTMFVYSPSLSVITIAIVLLAHVMAFSSVCPLGCRRLWASRENSRYLQPTQ